MKKIILIVLLALFSSVVLKVTSSDYYLGYGVYISGLLELPLDFGKLIFGNHALEGSCTYKGVKSDCKVAPLSINGVEISGVDVSSYPKDYNFQDLKVIIPNVKVEDITAVVDASAVVSINLTLEGNTSIVIDSIKQKVMATKFNELKSFLTNIKTYKKQVLKLLVQDALATLVEYNERVKLLPTTKEQYLADSKIFNENNMEIRKLYTDLLNKNNYYTTLTETRRKTFTELQLKKDAKDFADDKVAKCTLEEGMLKKEISRFTPYAELSEEEVDFFHDSRKINRAEKLENVADDLRLVLPKGANLEVYLETVLRREDYEASKVMIDKLKPFI